MPTGASSNISIGCMLYFGSIPLMTILVEVDMSVTLLVRIEANASGISSFEGEILARLARPITAGRKTAVAAVLLMKAETMATVTMMIIARKYGLPPP